MKTLLIRLAPLLLVTAAFAQPQQREWKDVSYVNDQLTGHRLDIHLPEEGDGPFPVIVAIAGSAWFGDNTKSRAYQNAKPLRDAGFAIVAVNHRSSRTAVYPAQIHDIKAAVRFVRGNAAEYHLDVRFIGVTGDSSGGHLSALMGTSGGVGNHRVGDRELNLEGALGSFTDRDSSVDAVVDWYGPTDFQQMDACGSSFSHDAADSPESTLVGGLIQENDAMCALVNPITYIDGDDPAFLILHGDADPLVPHCQSELLHAALTAKSVTSRLVIVPGGGHGQGMWIPQYTGQMVDFFLEQLKASQRR